MRDTIESKIKKKSMENQEDESSQEDISSYENLNAVATILLKMRDSSIEKIRPSVKSSADKTEKTRKIVSDYTELLKKLPQQAGETAYAVQDNELFGQIVETLEPLKKILKITVEDLEREVEEVERIRRKYPGKSSREIAQRIIYLKTFNIAGMEALSSGLLPGGPFKSITVDLVLILTMQARMVYQISVAYGLDPQSPMRQTEMLTLCGITSSGDMLAQEAGKRITLSIIPALIGSIPGIGALIAASSSAAINYAVGQGACKFYEMRSDDNNQAEFDNAWEEAFETTKNQLKSTSRQWDIMNDFMAHIVVLVSPDAQDRWDEFVPNLKRINLTDEAIKDIYAKIGDLGEIESLDTLLHQLKPGYAKILSVQCRRLFNLDHDINQEEQYLLDELNLMAEKSDNSISSMLDYLLGRI